MKKLPSLASLPLCLLLAGTALAQGNPEKPAPRIAFEESRLSRHPYDLLVEAWILPSQSLALRAKRGDGIIAPPRDFKSWQPFPPADPYPLGKYTWRD